MRPGVAHRGLIAPTAHVLRAPQMTQTTTPASRIIREAGVVLSRLAIAGPPKPDR
ncbi:hypothetical protein ACFOLD_05220 [Kocuria carniphila]|uniref:hypothetical protein n=1 Tax=Kocuria carniphila TaxID=262208 RepID=UPI003609D003